MKPSLFIATLRFSDGLIHIDYVDEEKQSPVAWETSTISIDIQEIEEEVQELQELLGELVDKGKLLIRNPPRRLRMGQRLVEDSIDDAEGTS